MVLAQFLKISMQIFLVSVRGAKAPQSVHEVRELLFRLVGQMPAVYVLHDMIEIGLD